MAQLPPITQTVVVKPLFDTEALVEQLDVLITCMTAARTDLAALDNTGKKPCRRCRRRSVVRRALRLWRRR